jgi:hypothetical protein
MTFSGLVEVLIAVGVCVGLIWGLRGYQGYREREYLISQFGKLSGLSKTDLRRIWKGEDRLPRN